MIVIKLFKRCDNDTKQYDTDCRSAPMLLYLHRWYLKLLLPVKWSTHLHRSTGIPTSILLDLYAIQDDTAYKEGQVSTVHHCILGLCFYRRGEHIIFYVCQSWLYYLFVTDCKYKFHNPEGKYFVTFSVVYWIDVFTRNIYREILLDSFKYCQNNKGLNIHGAAL